jgi:glutamyl-tRNA reductase
VEEPVLDLSRVPRDHVPSLIIDVSVPRALLPGDHRVIPLEELRVPYIQYVNGKARILNYIEEVREESRRLMRLLARGDSEEYVRDVMVTIESIRSREVEEAIRALRSGRSVEEVIEAMSRSIVKRIMSNYLGNMRRSAEEGRLDLVKLMRDYLIGDRV